MTLFEARDVTKRFAGITALDSVTIEIASGEFVGLIGPNGAGKTTLFNCLYGLLKPDRGRVLFDGKDITRLPTYRRARLGLARTFQRTELFTGMTVRDHLLVAERARSAGVTLWRDLVLKGRMTDAGRRSREVAEANGWWTIMDSVEDLVEPAELSAALDASPAARAAWDGFPPSARKQMLFSIVTAAQPATRASRVAKIVSEAEAGRRAVDVLRPLLADSGDDPIFQRSFARANELSGDLVQAGEAYAEAAYLSGRALDAIAQLETLKAREDLDYYQRARIEARIAAIAPPVLEMRRRGIEPERQRPGP